MLSKPHFVALGAAGLACAAPALAQQQQPAGTPNALAGLMSCRALTQDAQRLACFDREAQRLGTSVQAREVVVVDRESIRESRRSLFGLRLPRIAIFDNDEDAPKEIKSSISKVDKLNFDRHQLTLSDGSVWRTMEDVQGFFPRAGEEIVVSKAGIAGYRARIDGGRALRVERVR